MTAELRMTYLTPRPCSHVNAHHSARNNKCLTASKLSFTILSCKLLDHILKHSYIQVIAAALAYLSTCHLGAMRGLLGAAKLAHKFGQLQPS